MRIDLSGVWKDYLERPTSDGFVEFTKKRYRRRLGAGIALAVSGIGLLAGGMAILLISESRDNAVDGIGGFIIMSTGAILIIPGAILWPIHQVRLHKLRKAEAHLAARPALAPLILPRGAGLGLRLTF